MNGVLIVSRAVAFVFYPSLSILVIVESGALIPMEEMVVKRCNQIELAILK